MNEESRFREGVEEFLAIFAMSSRLKLAVSCVPLIPLALLGLGLLLPTDSSHALLSGITNTVSETIRGFIPPTALVMMVLAGLNAHEVFRRERDRLWRL